MNAGCIWMYYECTWLFCCSPDLDRFGMIWILGSLPQNVILRGYVKYERMNQKYQRVGVLWRLPQKNCRYGYVNIQHVHSSIPSIHINMFHLWRALEARSSCLPSKNRHLRSAWPHCLARSFGGETNSCWWRERQQKSCMWSPRATLASFWVERPLVAVFFWTTGSEFCCTLYIPCFFLKKRFCTKLFSCSNLQWCWRPDNLSTCHPWQ